jgi:hypothetical protein|tara:strand:+ start:463 stop:1827 length:1365 start_codon:yes stop_codon:yes gene_type:complete
MRFFEFKPNLIEAKGVFGRKPGEPYIHQNGEKATFQQVFAIPDLAQGGKFESPEARDQAIAEFEKNNNASIEWTNSPNSGTLAFGIAQIRTSDGKDIYWGRYLRQVKADMMGTWSNKEIPTGWSLGTKGAQKIESGLDPQTLIKSQQKFKGPEQIIQTVRSNLATDGEVLTKALEDTSKGQLAEFPGQIDKLESIRDYFGEIMGPVAMMGGLVQGDAEQARQELAGGANWKDLNIFWPMAMNYNLVDSVFLAPDGKEIGISSKGGSGAAASAKNLYDSLEKNKGNAELMANTKYVADIVTTIATKSAKEAPFELGERFQLSSPALRKEAEEYMSAGKSDFEGMSEEAQKMVEGVNFDSGVQGFNTGYAITSALAKKVALKVNENPEFSQQAISLLNTASIIQLYTKVGKKGDDVRVTGYQAVYPPNFQGTVALDGSKNYYSSRIGGKFAFRFVK